MTPIGTLAQPLLNHPRPQSDESLRSYLRRLTEANYLAPSTRLLQMLGLKKRHPEYERPNLATDEHQAAFEVMTGLTARAYDRLRVAQYAKLLHSPLGDWRIRGRGYQFLDQGWDQGFLDNATYVCPLCVRETGYERLSWDVKFVPACVVHSVLLRAEPVFSWRHSRSWPMPDLISIADDPAGVLAAALPPHFLGGTIPVDPVAQAQPGSPLHGMKAPIYFEFLRLLERILDDISGALPWPGPGFAKPQVAAELARHNRATMTGVPGRWRYAEVPSTRAHMYLMVKLAGQLLFNWPDAWYELLNAYREMRRGQGHALSLYSELGPLYSTCIAHHRVGPGFEFAILAMREYVARLCSRNPGLPKGSRAGSRNSSPQYRDDRAAPAELALELQAAREIQRQNESGERASNPCHRRGTRALSWERMETLLLERAREDAHRSWAEHTQLRSPFSRNT